MTYAEALEYIHSFDRFGVDLGLDRVERLLAECGAPQEKLRIVHVAGTNGKGSVCGMIAAALTSAGFKTGLYTSPFVTDFRERIQVNGEMIPPQSLAKTVEYIKPKIERLADCGVKITEFEAVTAAAFCYYRDIGADFVVLEVGLGGRLDATNVIKKPLVSVITSISLDHTSVLGGTVGEIAREKAGIIKAGAPVVTSMTQCDDALAVIFKAAAEAGVKVYTANPASARVISRDIGGTVAEYGGNIYKIGMVGKHQVENAALAVEALRVIRQSGCNVPQSAVERGIACAVLPARQEVISSDPLIMLDGAHNPDGMRRLGETIDELFGGRELTAVIGMLADKDVSSALGFVAGKCRKIYTVASKNARSMSPRELCSAASKYCADSVWRDNAADALFEALDSLPSDGALIVCGSLYLAGEMRPLLLEAAGSK